MGALTISMKDKDIIRYLQDGGDINNPACLALVLDLCSEAMHNDFVCDLFKKHDLEFSTISLSTIYLSILESTMPSPIVGGGPSLVATLFLTQPDILKASFSLYSSNLDTISPPDKNMDRLIEACKFSARIVKRNFDEKFGEYPLIVHGTPDQAVKSLEARKVGRQALLAIIAVIITIIVLSKFV